ncbi:unnamed protein product [Dovyalis caffra]|uniref:Uncharacterized protein n=1 Tax=Dovyalis caffra TaxID=77055 RepID=A0AAV1REH5_9ROSI|nr:unnamed protein product [Dovyalis caffra]
MFSVDGVIVWWGKAAGVAVAATPASVGPTKGGGGLDNRSCRSLSRVGCCTRTQVDQGETFEPEWIIEDTGDNDSNDEREIRKSIESSMDCKINAAIKRAASKN